jgi:large subunit ribosomal protein L14
MTCVLSVIKTADNSGAKSVKCIKIVKGKNCQIKLADIMVVVVKKAKAKKKVKKGDLRKAILVRCPYKHRREHYSIQFVRSSCVILDKNNNPLGSRLFGPVMYELRESIYSKVLMMSGTAI